MTEKMFVRPTEGATIPDPFTRENLPDTGAWVDRNSIYYQKLLQETPPSIEELTGDQIPEKFRPGQEGTVEAGEPPPALESMTRAELETEAATRGIDVSGAKTKGEIIEALNASGE